MAPVCLNAMRSFIVSNIFIFNFGTTRFLIFNAVLPENALYIRSFTVILKTVYKSTDNKPHILNNKEQ